LIVATQKNRCPSIEGSGEFRGDLSPLLHERPTNRGIIAAIMAGAYRKLTRMTDPDSSATVRYSTADLPENMRIATWHEHYGHTVLRAHIEPNVDSFGVTLDLRNLPGLKLVWGKFTSARIIRTREMIADGNDDLYLFVNQTGHITVSARGRDVTLYENDAVLISSGEAVVFDRHSSVGESITTRIPYSMLSPMVVDVDDAIMHRMPSNTTFSEFLLGQRLARAYRMLCEPQSAQRQVSAIAYDVGFSDLSYFNRCFRRHYGATPTDMRKAVGN